MKKLILALALATAVASPALAQSFDSDFGTGNELPFAYQTSSHAGRSSELAAHAEVGATASQVNAAPQADPNSDGSCFVSPSSMNFTSCQGD